MGTNNNPAAKLSPGKNMAKLLISKGQTANRTHFVDKILRVFVVRGKKKVEYLWSTGEKTEEPFVRPYKNMTGAGTCSLF